MPIANHSYNEGTKTYEVQFKDGGPKYLYQGVEPDVAATIQNAPDDELGKLVQSTLVRGKPYEFVRVDPDEEDHV